MFCGYTAKHCDGIWNNVLFLVLFRDVDRFTFICKVSTSTYTFHLTDFKAFILSTHKRFSDSFSKLNLFILLSLQA